MTGRHDELRALITRRRLLGRSAAGSLGLLVAQALPPARAPRAFAATPSTTDATLQAFADTMIPGRKVAQTASGQDVDPRAIAGVDPLPGAVEADALALYHHPEIGFDALAPGFLADLEARALMNGGDFLSLPFEARVQTCLSGLDFANQSRLVWEAAAAVPFTAFCAAALVVNATAATAPGYRVMGLPGTAPNGYPGFSYGRPLARERTLGGSLP